MKRSILTIRLVEPNGLEAVPIQAVGKRGQCSDWCIGCVVSKIEIVSLVLARPLCLPSITDRNQSQAETNAGMARQMHFA
jgi:hypothetical protein